MKEFSNITDSADSQRYFTAEENFSDIVQQQLQQMNAHARSSGAASLSVNKSVLKISLSFKVVDQIGG